MAAAQEFFGRSQQDPNAPDRRTTWHPGGPRDPPGPLQAGSGPARASPGLSDPGGIVASGSAPDIDQRLSEGRIFAVGSKSKTHYSLRRELHARGTRHRHGPRRWL
eukprot:scaffold25271_cov105-Isochrysis_galbana.AAC.1